MTLKPLRDEKMWTQEHWELFNTMEKCYRDNFTSDEFGSNFDNFKEHMLYILNIMEHMYGSESSKDKKHK